VVGVGPGGGGDFGEPGAARPPTGLWKGVVTGERGAVGVATSFDGPRGVDGELWLSTGWWSSPAPPAPSEPSPELPPGRAA